MSIHRTRLLLRGAATLLLLSSVALIVWAVLIPAPVGDHGSGLAAATRSSAEQAALVRSPPLDDFAQVWRTELRRPLYDPPPALKAAKTEDGDEQPRESRPLDPAGEAGGLQLVGTMLEHGRSLAVFTNATGQIDLKGVGEVLELAPGMRVDRIELTQVTISDQGRPTVLRLPDAKER